MYKAEFYIGRGLFSVPYNHIPLKEVIKELATRHSSFSIYDHRSGALLYSKKEGKS